MVGLGREELRNAPLNERPNQLIYFLFFYLSPTIWDKGADLLSGSNSFDTDADLDDDLAEFQITSSNNINGSIISLNRTSDHNNPAIHGQLPSNPHPEQESTPPKVNQVWK